MLVYKKSYKHILLQGGLGLLSANWAEASSYCSNSNYTSVYYCENNDYIWYGNSSYTSKEYESDSSVGLRLGLGYKFPIGKYIYLKPSYEFNYGFSGERLSFHNFSLNIGLTK